MTDADLRTIRPHVLRLCRRWLNADEAEDATQETLLTLWRYNIEEAPLRSTVAKRICWRFLLRRRARSECAIADAALLTDPFPVIWGRLDVRGAWEGLRDLPEGQRRALLLTARGSEATESARVLGASLPQVKAWIRRGRHKLNRLSTYD